jgi:uncharacterized protein
MNALFKRYLFLSQVCLWLAVSAPTLAKPTPSFDCDFARQSVEKLICSDDQLASLDLELSNVFSAYKKAAPEKWGTNEQGQEKIKAFAIKGAVTDQRRWLRDRTTACLIGSAATSNRQASQCLAGLYALRINHLKSAAGLPTGLAATDIPQALSLTKVVNLYRVSPSETKLLNNQLLSVHVTPDGQSFQVMHVDPATGTQMDLDAHLGTTQYVYADAEHTVLEAASVNQGKQVFKVTDAQGHVILSITTDRPAQTNEIRNGVLFVSQPVRAFHISGNNLYVVTGDDLTGLSLAIYDLSTKSLISSAHSALAGRVEFWKSNPVVLTYEGRLVVCSEALQEVASSASLVNGPFKATGIPTFTIDGDYLILQYPDSAIRLFNLSTMALIATIGTPNPIYSYHAAISGTLLFLMPKGQLPTASALSEFQDPVVQPNSLSVYDLQSNRKIVTWHIDATDFALTPGGIATHVRVPWVVDRLVTYNLDLARLREKGLRLQALTDAYRRAKLEIESTGSSDEALRLMDDVDTDELRSGRNIQEVLLPAAVDFASWQAATVQRNAEGVRLLSQIVALKPGDVGIRQRMGAALLFNYLVTRDTGALARSREALGDRFPSQDIALWQSVGIAPEAIFQSAGLGSSAPTAFSNDMNLNTREGKLSCRTRQVQGTSWPPITCWLRHTKGRNSRDKAGDRYLSSKYLARGIGAENIDQHVLADLLLSGKTGDPLGLALSSGWLIRDEQPGDVVQTDSLASFTNLQDKTVTWREANIPPLMTYSSAWLVGDEPLAVVAYPHAHYTQFVGVNLKENVSSTLLKIGPVELSRSWGLSGGLLIAHTRDEVVVYDVHARSLAVVLPVGSKPDPTTRLVPLMEYARIGARLFQDATKLLLN